MLGAMWLASVLSPVQEAVLVREPILADAGGPLVRWVVVPTIVFAMVLLVVSASWGPFFRNASPPSWDGPILTLEPTQVLFDASSMFIVVGLGAALSGVRLGLGLAGGADILALGIAFLLALKVHARLRRRLPG